MLSAIYLSFDYKVLRSDVFKRLTSLTDSYTSISPLTSIGKIFASIMKDVTLQIILSTVGKVDEYPPASQPRAQGNFRSLSAF